MDRLLWWEQLALTQEQGEAIDRTILALETIGASPPSRYALASLLLPPISEVLERCLKVTESLDPH